MPQLASKGFALDKAKPLVVEYFDADAIVLDYMKTRLPSVKGGTARFHRVYQSSDKTISKFRVNYWSVSQDMIPVRKIIHSVYVEVLTGKDGAVKGMTL